MLHFRLPVWLHRLLLLHSSPHGCCQWCCCCCSSSFCCSRNYSDGRVRIVTNIHLPNINFHPKYSDAQNRNWSIQGNEQKHSRWTEHRGPQNQTYDTEVKDGIWLGKQMNKANPRFNLNCVFITWVDAFSHYFECGFYGGVLKINTVLTILSLFA